MLEMRFAIPASDATSRPSAGAGSAAADRPVVLIVDDNADLAQALARLVTLLGYLGTVALDGQTAVDLARRLHPRVVLLDINLPDMTGYEVGQTIRDDPALRETRVIALSAHEEVAAPACPFDHYLLKPFDVDALPSLLAVSS